LTIALQTSVACEYQQHSALSRKINLLKQAGNKLCWSVENYFGEKKKEWVRVDRRSFFESLNGSLGFHEGWTEEEKHNRTNREETQTGERRKKHTLTNREYTQSKRKEHDKLSNGKER